MRLVVVGAGVAGTSAALHARAAGATVTVVAGPFGASALASGAWDVVPMDAPALPPFADTRTLADRVRALVDARPDHPYARLSGDPVERIQLVHDRLLAALAIYRPLHVDRSGVLVATDFGLVRRVPTCQHALLALDEHATSVVGVACMRGIRTPDGSFVARSLAELVDRAGDTHRYVDLVVDYARRRSDVLASLHELASLADADDARTRLAIALATAAAPSRAAAMLVPPVLGLARDDAPEWIARNSGLAVGELAQPLGGPQGSRLARRLAAALREAGCTLAEGPAGRLVVGPPTRVELASGETLEGDAVVLAAGTLAGALVAAAPRHLPWDTRLRALRADGKPMADDLFVAGDLLAGADSTRNGLGCAAVTGAAAAEHALAR